MYLLDTNNVIYLMKNTYPQLSAKLLTLPPSETAISAITVFELEYGAGKSKWGDRTRQLLYRFLAPFQLVPFEMADAVEAGRIRAYLEQRGSPIGPFDTQIAAQALSREMVLVTHNTKEFSRVPGLTVEDWV